MFGWVVSAPAVCVSFVAWTLSLASLDIFCLWSGNIDVAAPPARWFPGIYI